MFGDKIWIMLFGTTNDTNIINFVKNYVVIQSNILEKWKKKWPNEIATYINYPIMTFKYIGYNSLKSLRNIYKIHKPIQPLLSLVAISGKP